MAKKKGGRAAGHIPVVDSVFRGRTSGGYMRTKDDDGYNALVVWDLGVDENMYPLTEKKVTEIRFDVDKRDEVVNTAMHLALAFGNGAILQEIAYYDTPNVEVLTPRFVVKNGNLVPLSDEISLALFNDVSAKG